MINLFLLTGDDEGVTELEREGSDVVTARPAPSPVGTDHRQVLDEARQSGKIPGT